MSTTDIMTMSADAFGVTTDDIRSKRRQRRITTARKAYIFACYTHGMTQEEIAGTLGCNRSYITYAMKTVAYWITSPTFENETKQLLTLIKQIK
jgi:chromosomal replication initiation ATPase DnaA